SYAGCVLPLVLLRVLCSALSRPRFLSDAAPPPPLFTLSLHDALPISSILPPNSYNTILSEYSAFCKGFHTFEVDLVEGSIYFIRSEEHTSELQSRFDLVCRLLLEIQTAVAAGERVISDDRLLPPPQAG